MIDVPFECPECGKSCFSCPACGEEIKIDDMVDIFHVGVCKGCGGQDEPCPERVK